MFSTRHTIKLIGHHSRLRDVVGQSYLICACTLTNNARYVIHRSKLHFAVARNLLYKSNTQEKTWQVESVEYIEQSRIKFVETSYYLKRRGRKAFVE